MSKPNIMSKPNYLEIGKECDKLMEHLGVVEDERNALLNEKEEIYEAAVGDDGVNRYTHDELKTMIFEMYDCYKWMCEFGNEIQMKKDLYSIGEAE